MSNIAAPVKPTPLFRRPAVFRLLVIGIFAEIGYAALNLSTMPVYLTQDRQFGASVVGLVLAAFLVAEAIFKSPMGHLADRYGPKRLMLLGPAISAVTSLLSLIVPHTGGQPLEVFAFVMLRGLDGIALAMLWPAAFAEMNAAVEDHERQQGMSLLNLCYMLGIALAFPVGGIANDLSGVRWAGLVLAAGLFLAVAFSVWRFVPDLEHAEIASETHGGGGINGFLASMKQIPEYLVLAMITFIGIGFPTFIFKLFPIQQFGFSESQIGALIFPGAIVMALASVPMSKFGEKIGRVRAVHLGMGLAAIGMSIIAMGAFIPILRQPWLLAGGGIPVGIGFLLAIPAWMASVSDIDPNKRGANIGAVMTAQGIGAMVGAPIGAAMYEKLQPLGVQLGLGAGFGRYSPFVGCAACMLVSWLLGLKILRDGSSATSTEPVPLVHDVVGIATVEKAAVAEEEAAAADQATNQKNDG